MKKERETRCLSMFALASRGFSAAAAGLNYSDIRVQTLLTTVRLRGSIVLQT